MALQSAELRAFLKQAELLGFVLDGYSGTSHPRLKHPNGAVYFTSLTPSDHRARTNALHDLERLSGRKLPRPNSGRYKNSHTPVLSTRRTAEERARSEEIDGLVKEAEAARKHLAVLVAHPSRRGASDAAGVIARYERVRARLAVLHYIIPELAA